MIDQKEFERLQKANCLNIDDIKLLLPHRSPILLVEKVINFEAGKSIVTQKSVSINEPIFEGHFPDFPIFPGVFQVEMLAQSGALMVFLSDIENIGKKILFTGMDKVKFRKEVRPGDQITGEVNLVRKKMGLWFIKGQALVGNNVVCEGKFQAALS